MEHVEFYRKQDIMKILQCESDKALKILKFLYQTKEANKIGKEYYISKQSFINFMTSMQGKEIII